MSRSLKIARDMRITRFQEIVQLFLENQPKWIQKVNPFLTKQDCYPNIIYHPPDVKNRMEETWMLIPVELWKTQKKYSIHIPKDTACIALFLYGVYEPSKQYKKFKKFNILYNLCIDYNLNFINIIQQGLIFVVAPLDETGFPNDMIYFYYKGGILTRGLLQWSITKHCVKEILERTISTDLHKLPWFTDYVLHEYYYLYQHPFGSVYYINDPLGICIPLCRILDDSIYTRDQLIQLFNSADRLILDYMTYSYEDMENKEKLTENKVITQ